MTDALSPVREGDPPVAEAVAASAKRSSFAGDMMRLVSGTMFAQVVSLLATPLITRLFGPDAYGAAVAFGSIVSVIGVFLCLRYEQAIVLPADDTQAANVLGLSLASAAVVTGVTAIVLWFWSVPLLALIHLDELAPYMWMIAPALAVNACLYVLTAWNGRKRQFSRVASGHMVNSFVTAGARISSGLAGFNGSGAMIATNIFGSLVTVIFLGISTLQAYLSLFRQAIRPAGMVAMLRKYRDQPLFSTWASLLNTISWQLPIFMLTAFFTPAVAGQYALGNRIVSMPMNLVGDSMSKVFYQRAAETSVHGGLSALTEATYRRLVTFGLPPMLFLAVAGQDLFVLVFGAEWADAGVYIQILSIWAFFWFITSPLSTLTLVLGKQRFFLGWNIVNFATRLLALWIGGRMGSPFIALGLFGASGVLVYGFLSFYLLSAAGVPLRRSLGILSKGALVFMPIAALMLLLKLLGAPLWLEIGLPALLVGSILLYSFRAEPQVQQVLRRLQRNRQRTPAQVQ